MRFYLKNVAHTIRVDQVRVGVPMGYSLWYKIKCCLFLNNIFVSEQVERPESISWDHYDLFWVGKEY